MKHPPSILQPDRKQDYLWAVLEGLPVSGELEKHHIFGGTGRRDMSEANGFWIWLRPENHTGANAATNKLRIRGVHSCKAVDIFVKAACQYIYLQTHGMDEWMGLVGRSYLDDGMPIGMERWPAGLQERLVDAWMGLTAEAEYYSEFEAEGWDCPY